MELSNILTIIGMAVMVIAAFFATKNDILLVRNDLNNHKENHAKLEQRVSDHEKKIDEKLEKILSAIGDIKEDIAKIK